MLTMALEGLEELEAALDRAEVDIRDGVVRAVERAVVEGAGEAYQRHTYQDQTGNLTDSIDARMTDEGGEDEYTTGAAGVIEAKAPYASFVENGTSRSKARPFMSFAYEKAERVLEREIEIACAIATEKA